MISPSVITAFPSVIPAKAGIQCLLISPFPHKERLAPDLIREPG